MSSVIPDLLAELSTAAPDRIMVSYCPVGRNLNEMRKTVVRREDEHPADYADRRLAILKLVAGNHGCTDRQTCASCPDGQALFVEELHRRTALFWQHHSVSLVFSKFSEEGWSRTLSPLCPITEGIQASDAFRGLHPEAAAAIRDALEEQHLCKDQISCLTCELGQGVFHEILLDLAEHGLEQSEWAEKLCAR